MHANSPGECGAWLCINLIVGKDFTSWLQSIHQLLILYVQEKFWGRGKTPPFFTTDFSGNLMLKLLREEALGCEKYQSQLPFSFHYFWCNTLPNNWFYCFLLSGFKSVVCRFLGFLDSLGCLKVVLRKAGLLLVSLNLLYKSPLYARKIFCVCTKLKDGK